MKLYQGWHSSASWRVRWALAIKQLTYESVWLDIAAGEHLHVLAGRNPLLTVPTLELAPGDVLSESVAIIEWLDEVYRSPPLLPGDARERARVRELVQLVNADIHPLQNTIVRRAISPEADTQRAWCARWIERGLRAYEAQLALHGGPFSVGDQLTMAELFLVPQVQNAKRFGVELTACPRVEALFRVCLALAEAQATHPRQAAEEASRARGRDVT
jgi:maleylacetoacetate isomerase